MNKLPSVYQNPINTPLNNNLESVRVEHRCYENEPVENINTKINEIFSSNNFVYKKVAHISTSNNQITATIVGRSGNYLITLEHGNILISDIKKIVI